MSRLKQLIREVHQRSLWQALVVYLGASWAVIEAVAFFTDRYTLPAWLLNVALVLLLMGLPLVVVTSLAREETYGDEVPAEARAAADAEDRRLRRLTWRSSGLALLGALALWGVLAAGWLALGGGAPLAARELKSIAVLPFNNLSPDTADAYFSDGITDEIITRLGKVHDLQVTSWTTSIQYRNSEKTLRQVADELGVAAILEGAVRRSGDRVRISAQLIDAESDAHLWAESYDRQLSDIFDVQSDIAKRITSALRATLTPVAKRWIEQEPTDNMQAYEYYLRAKSYYWERNDLAVQMLEKAIELDPTFARAYADLARIYSAMPQSHEPGSWGGARRAEHLEAARNALEKAIEYAPDDPDVHRQAGYYFYANRDYQRAIDEWTRYEELDPDIAYNDFRFATALRRMGRWEKALEHFEKQYEADPAWAPSVYEFGTTHLALHNYEEAELFFDRTLDLKPDDIWAYVMKARLYIARDGDRGAADAMMQAQCEAADLPFPRFGGVTGFRLLADHYVDAVIQASSPAALGWEEGYDYYMAKGWAYELAGLAGASRAYFDSARSAVDEQVRFDPANAGLHSRLGLAHAHLGNKPEAIREGEMAVQLMPLSKDALDHPDRVDMLARIYALAGEYDAAIDKIEYLLSMPGADLSIPWLRVDPMFDPLRDHPRFQALLANER